MQDKPPEGALHNPSARQDREPLLAFLLLDDLECNARGCRVLQEALLVAAVHPACGDGRVPGGQLGDDVLAAVGVLHRGGGDDQGQQEAEGIDGDVPLAPLVRLPASYPWLASATFEDALTACASMIAAVGSAARPACSRALPRSRSWIACVVPSFSHLA